MTSVQGRVLYILSRGGWIDAIDRTLYSGNEQALGKVAKATLAVLQQSGWVGRQPKARFYSRGSMPALEITSEGQRQVRTGAGRW
jgi:hypothetical protein